MYGVRVCTLYEHVVCMKSVTNNNNNISQTSSIPVVVVAASSHPERVHPRLRCPGKLDREVMVPLPDTRHRALILHRLLAAHRHTLHTHQVQAIANRAYGFSGADLSVLLRCAWLACVNRVNQSCKVSQLFFYLTSKSNTFGCWLREIDAHT